MGRVRNKIKELFENQIKTLMDIKVRKILRQFFFVYIYSVDIPLFVCLIKKINKIKLIKNFTEILIFAKKKSCCSVETF